METVTSNIRSVLISTKGKSDLRQLQKDYRMLMGEDIPYRKFGHSNLESFMKTVPTLNVTQIPGGNLLIEAVPSNKTKHMSQLISKQKTSKRKTSSSGRLPPRSSSRLHRRSSPRNHPSTSSPARTNQQWRTPFVSQAKPRPHVHQLVVSVPNEIAGANSLQQRLVRNVSGAPLMKQTSQNSSENSARKNPRLTRSTSSPLSCNNVNINQREIPSPTTTSTPMVTPPVIPTPRMKSVVVVPQSTQTPQLKPNIISDSRPRMRFINNTTPPPMFSEQNNLGARTRVPTLSKNEIEKLLNEAVAQYDPAGSVWHWSSSDDSSSPQRSVSNNNPPKIEPKESPKEVSPARRHSDTSNNTTTSQSHPSHIEKTEELRKLKQFAAENILGEVYVRVLARAVKNPRATQFYDCCIKLDGQSFSSYPRDCTSPEEAEAEAARQAYSELSARYTIDRKNRKLLLSTEHDILSRIPPIIECHFHGIWAAQLASDYEEKYSEQLPPNWLALLDTLPTISVEPTLDNKYVLKVCQIGEKNINPNPVANQLTSEVSVPSNKINLSVDEWTVEVTFAASTVEVWCRIIDSEDSNRYFDVNQVMQKYYSNYGAKERATNVSAGGFYVVQFDNCWSRVRVLSTGEHDVSCYFIDFGDEQTVSRSDMYELKREFAKEQAQAFVCRLSGLEELANMKAAQTRLEQIGGKTYTAKPQIHELVKESGPEAISIILYETESSEDDVVIENEEDVNHLLMRQITNDSVLHLDPHNINRVYLSHATDKGDLYIQPHCEAFTKITELIEALNQVDFDQEFPGPHIPQTGTPEATPDQDASRLYLARWTQQDGDGNLYRCRVVDRSPCGQYVQLFFIDYGNTQIVNVKNPESVYPLEKISEVLMAFPPLATRIRLDLDLQINPKTKEEAGFAKKIMDLMPSDQPILLRIIKSMIDEDGISVPVCELFRRSESHNELYSVNASLRYGRGSEGDHCETSFEDGNNNDDVTTQLAKKLERIRSFTGYADNKPVPSTGELESPHFPEPGSFFDVRIPFAVNPWNFFVQPYSSAKQLTALMDELQQRFKGTKRYRERVHLEDVVPGRIYAAKHTDGIWYRTSVIKIINSGSISVFYCDVGYYANLTVEQLFPLDPEFLALPYQAIKARLEGIKPKDAKWSMDDCRHFEKLVREQNFVSSIVSVQQDELYKCDIVLVLRLIDTSTDKDIFLDKLLIEEGIAAASD